MSSYPYITNMKNLLMSYFIFSNLCHVCETQCMLYSCRNSQSRPAMLQLVKCFTGVQIRHGNSEWGISWQMVQRHLNKRRGGERHLHSPDEHTHLLSNFSVCEKVIRNNIWSEQKSFPQHFSKNDTLYYFRKGIFWNQQAYVEFWSQLDAQRKSERPMQCSKHS